MVNTDRMTAEMIKELAYLEIVSGREHKEMPPNNLRKPVAKFTDFIRFTLNKMRRLFSGSS